MLVIHFLGIDISLCLQLHALTQAHEHLSSIKHTAVLEQSVHMFQLFLPIGENFIHIILHRL
jgi:hypothetical protein